MQKGSGIEKGHKYGKRLEYGKIIDMQNGKTCNE